MNVFNCVEEELRKVCFHCMTLSSSSSLAISSVIHLLNEKRTHKNFGA